jgi:hypothetical protein
MLRTELNNLRSKTGESNNVILHRLHKVDSRLNNFDVNLTAAVVEGVRLSNKFDATIALIRTDFQSFLDRLSEQQTDIENISATTELIDQHLAGIAPNTALIPLNATAPRAVTGNLTSGAPTQRVFTNVSGFSTLVSQFLSHGVTTSTVTANVPPTTGSNPLFPNANTTSSVPPYQGTNPSSAQHTANPADPNYVPPLLWPGAITNPAGEALEYSELDQATI